MGTRTANGVTPCRDSRLSLWRRVREFAVPPSMIERATARRLAGDWAGACAAAGVDVDFRIRDVARAYGSDVAERLRGDLRHLAPDLLRWHMPRVAPDGLLRPGVTVTLARYGTGGGRADRPVHLVVRTPPAWADGGQRMSLALWDGDRGRDGAARAHPHPLPSPRFRLDLHRHLWDVRRASELRERAGADGASGDIHVPDTEPSAPWPPGCAVARWADEAALLLRAGRRRGRRVLVRLGGRQRLVLEVAADGTRLDRIACAPPGRGGVSALPVLPDAATWVPPDLALLRAGLVGPGALHPLVAAALVPGHTPTAASGTGPPPGQPYLVECRGARHRIGLVGGVLTALDHAPDEVCREELLAAFGGPPLPCLRAIDQAHRRPDCLTGVRERLDHGDTAGALAVVEALLGPAAVLRDGPLRDALETAAERRVAHGLFRADLAVQGGGRRRGRGSGTEPDRGRGKRHTRRSDSRALFY